MWDITDPHQPQRICATTPGFDWIDIVSFSPDGRMLATAGGFYVKLWNLRSSDGFLFRKSHSLVCAHTAHQNGRVQAVAFSPDSRTLAVATEETVTLWDISEPYQPTTLAFFRIERNICAILFSPDGRILTTIDISSSSYRSKITWWDITDLAFPPSALAEFVGHLGQFMAFSADRRTIVTGSFYRGYAMDTDAGISFWDITDLDRVFHISTIPCLPIGAFSPDGGTFASSGGVSGSLVLWNIERSQR